MVIWKTEDDKTKLLALKSYKVQSDEIQTWWYQSDDEQIVSWYDDGLDQGKMKTQWHQSVSCLDMIRSGGTYGDTKLALDF